MLLQLRVDSDSEEKMGDELTILLEAFHKIEKAGGQATLSLSTSSGKTKVKLEIPTTAAPPSASPSPSTSSAPGRRHRRLGDEAPLVAQWTVPQTNGLVFGGTASRVETDDDAFECEGRDKGEGTGSEPDDSNKAADTQGRVALIEDKRPFKAEKAVVEALRTVLQLKINILAAGGTARGEADDNGALDGNIDNSQSGNDEAGEDVANEEKAVDNEAADEYHLVSTLSGAGGLESAARSAKCMNLGCQGSQWKILGNGKFSEQQGGKQFELNAGSSVGEDDAGESS